MILEQPRHVTERHERDHERSGVDDEFANADVVEDRFVGIAHDLPSFGGLRSWFPFGVSMFHSFNIVYAEVSVNGK